MTKYDDMLKEYKATALYTGNRVSADKYPIIHAFFKGLNEWQRDKFLVAELQENRHFETAMYLFTPTYRFEFLIRGNSVLTSAHCRMPRAGETWERQMDIREGDLTVEHLNTALKVMMTNEAETISPWISGNPDKQTLNRLRLSNHIMQTKDMSRDEANHFIDTHELWQPLEKPKRHVPEEEWDQKNIHQTVRDSHEPN